MTLHDSSWTFETFPSLVTYLLEAEVNCPWCGEYYPTTIDTSQGDHETIEDCAVCCRPIQLMVRCEPGEIESLESSRG